MFEHSVKVPKNYKAAANIVKKVATEGASVKTLLYDTKLRHYSTNTLYALIAETIKHAAALDKIFELSQILTNEPRLDPWLAKVLTTELLYGKKSLPGNSKPVQTILSYREKIENYAAENQDENVAKETPRPRYVRINTNLLTTSDAIGLFQDEGYRFIRCTSGSYNDYLTQIQGLTEEDFTQDYHVKTVFVFAAGTKLHEHPLYLENKILLQDKATALAVHLLAPPSGSVVLDMCAAPGMKTTHLAAYMRNEGRIYAVERNEKRYQTLCSFVESTDCKCVTTLNQDSLELKRGDYDDVEYILLDPSCSGSGMDLNLHNYIEPARLAKLTSLQEKFLKHAMNAFPNAKKIVYSTCSLYPEENERVVTNVVKFSRSKWRVLDTKELLKGNWNNFGSNMYGSIGMRCLYAKPDSDLTKGFFLAVLERDQSEIDKQKEHRLNNGTNQELNGDVKKKKKNKKDKNEAESMDSENNDAIGEAPETVEKERKSKKNNIVTDATEPTEETSKKKKKRKHSSTDEGQNDECRDEKRISKKHSNVISEPVAEQEENEEEEVPRKSKKKKKHKEEGSESKADDIALEPTDTGVSKKKKKKRDANIEVE